ncbi:hypothetical protein LTS18_013608, partial [Coniosporium uncinatum]
MATTTLPTTHQPAFSPPHASPSTHLLANKPASKPTSTSTPSTKPTLSAEPNVQTVVLGNLQIRAWYPSFYPPELIGGGGGGNGNGRVVERL